MVSLESKKPLNFKKINKFVSNFSDQVHSFSLQKNNLSKGIVRNLWISSDKAALLISLLHYLFAVKLF